MKCLLICCAAFLLSSVAAACAQETPPSQSTIAFVSNRSGTFGIYAVGADGSGLTRLTDDPAGDAWPAWSPDGGRIAFRRGLNRIMVMDADGANPVLLATSIGDNPEFDLTPGWSPDGSKVLFDTQGENSRDIFVAEADGSELIDLTPDAFDDSHPLWSPEGSWILFESTRPSGRGLYRMQPDGEKIALVSENGMRASWSPDGSRFAFLKLSDLGSEIHVMNLDGSDERNLTPSDMLLIILPSWSPDGSRIAFTALGPGNETLALYVMRADGSNPSVVAEDLIFDMNGWLPPAWSPDGGRLAFTVAESPESSDTEIQVVGIDGGSVTQLAVDPAEDGDPVWAPAGRNED